MKKIKKWLVVMFSALMAFATFGLVSCGDDTENSSSLDSISSETDNSSSEGNKYLEYFDLMDEKIIFDEAVLSNSETAGIVCLDRLEIYLKKAKVYEELAIEDFELDNITNIDYYEFKPQEDKMEDIQYMENFRQKLGVGFTNVNNIRELITMIREIEKLDFVKEVQIIIAVDDV
ncbi:MAG: hypothetical protein IJV83_04120 [Clostridia bacterium]|nr:hypothetical protein [Clostridia bacterium]